MNDEPYELAAILSSGEPGDLYSGLSLLVSTAVDGARFAALVAFGALELMADRELEATVARRGHSDKFARSLAELRDTALDLDTLTVWACAASVDTMDVEPGPRMAVMSTPRFLRETTAARRFVHV